MSYYPEPYSCIRDKVKVGLELKYAASVGTSNLAAQSGFIALKDEVDRLQINKLVLNFQFPTGLNSKTIVYDLDVGKLTIVLIKLEKPKWCSE